MASYFIQVLIRELSYYLGEAKRSLQGLQKYYTHQFSGNLGVCFPFLSKERGHKLGSVKEGCYFISSPLYSFYEFYAWWGHLNLIKI